MAVATHIDTASAESMIAIFANAVKCIPLMTGDKSEAKYNKAPELIEYLVDRDELSNPLFEPLAAKITEYETAPLNLRRLTVAWLRSLPGSPRCVP